MQNSDVKRFVIKRSELATIKLFVEFYLPKYQHLLNALKRSPYPLMPLRDLNVRIFDGPFGSNRKVDMYQDSGIPYVRVKDVLPQGINIKGLTYISEEKHQSLVRSRVVPGNVLVTIAGRVGTAAVFPIELAEGNITGHIAGIQVLEHINPYYLAAFINSSLGEFQITRWSHRTTRPELNLRELEQILISVPPRAMQDRIAETVQDVYRSGQNKLAKAVDIENQVGDFVLRKLGINWLNIEDTKRFTVARSALGRTRFDVRYFSPRTRHALTLLEKSGHHTVPLSELIHSISYGASVNNSYADDGIPFLRIGNLKPNFIDTANVVFFDESMRTTLGNSFVEEGDLLMSRSGSVGIVAVVPPQVDGFAFGSFQIKFRLHEGIVNPYYVSYFLNSQLGKAQSEQQKTGSIQMNITIEGIKALRVPIPSPELQDEIIREADVLRAEAVSLRTDASSAVSEAKARVERMILGED